MKAISKRLLAVLFCVALLCGSALAIDTEAFLEKNQASLEARGIERFTANKFHDGLLLVQVKNTWGYKLNDRDGGFVPDTVYNYINEKGEIVDLNRGRFSEMYPFSEGLAPVFDVSTDKVGYIDTTGKLVIPCRYGIAWGLGDLSVGYFWEGQCIVFEEDAHAGDVFSSEPVYWSIGKIDKTGKLVEPFRTEKQRHGGLGLVGQGGVMGHYEEPAEPAFDEDITFVIDNYTPPLYVDNGGEFQTDYGISYSATATNNTGEAVDAHYALVSYMPRQIMWTGTPRFEGQVHFFDIALAHGESKLCAFDSEFTGLTTGFNFIWVKFDSKADMEQFKASVPLKTKNERAIRDTSDGVKWMKDNFNITIAPVK